MDETSGEGEDKFWEEVDVHLAHGNHLLLQGILGFLRTEINDVTPTQTMRTELEGLLEVEEVPNQETAHKLIGRIVGFLRRICAPVRDEDLDRINNALVAHKQLPSPASLLRGLVRVVRLMRMDLANHHLASIRPLLSQLAPQYEREFLANQISSGALSLPKTRDWLLSTRDLLMVLPPDFPSSSAPFYYYDDYLFIFILFLFYFSCFFTFSSSFSPFFLFLFPFLLSPFAANHRQPATSRGDCSQGAESADPFG
jgi:hypothetical protein